MRNTTLNLTGLVCFFFLFATQANKAQTLHACNHEISHEDYAHLRDVVAKRSINRNANTCVAIQAHIVTNDDQTGGTPLFSLNYALSCLNANFAKVGISFYWAASPMYIANTALYNYNFANNTELDMVSATTESIEAINIYFVNSITSASGVQFAGYAYTPNGDNIGNNRMFVTNLSLMASPHGTIVHEMGHYFGLLHTHHNTENGPNSTLSENVARTGVEANCQNSGDLICDTEADPRFEMANFNHANCQYTGTQTDQYGKVYHPNVNNIMSYFPDDCGGEFTDAQIERMLQGLAERLSYNTYDITAAAFAAGVPQDAYAVLNNQMSSILVRWEYNQANIGFLVQRANSIEGPFEDLIGGATNPNVTFFEDHNIVDGQQYYYRVRLANGECGQFSNVATTATETTTICIPTYNNANGAAYIEKFEIAAGSIKVFTKYSAWNPQNYEAVNAPEAVVSADKKYLVTIRTNTTTNTYIPQFISIWADMNGDAIFDEATEMLLQTTQPTENRTFTGEITLPATTDVSLVRLRVRSSTQGIVFSSCQTYTAGETEDYLITVLPSTLTVEVATSYLHATQMGATANLEFGVINTPQSGSLVLDRVAPDGTAIRLSTMNAVQAQDAQFELVDLMPINGENTYRLLFIDNNGQETELKNQILDFSSSIESTEAHVWPNPATSFANIDFTSNIEAKTTVLLMDSNGHTHYNTTIESQKGINTVNFNTDGLPTGSYSVVIAQRSHRIVQTLQIIHQ